MDRVSLAYACGGAFKALAEFPENTLRTLIEFPHPSPWSESALGLFRDEGSSSSVRSSNVELAINQRGD
jgi:hypothetical protein